MIARDNYGQRTRNVIDISRTQCVPRCPHANHIVSIANSRQHKYLYSRLDCNEITLALSAAGRLCSIVRLSASDVQLNSVRTKFICKVSYFYSIQRILLGSVRFNADTIEFAWTAP